MPEASEESLRFECSIATPTPDQPSRARAPPTL